MVFYWSLSNSKSPGLFSVFWPILIMLLSGWSPLALWFLSLQFLLKTLGDCSVRSNYNWYHRHPYVPHFFKNLHASSWYLFLFSLSFILTLWSTIQLVLFFCWLSLFFFHHTTCGSTCDTPASSAANQGDNIMWGHQAKIRWSVCISKSQRTLSCEYTICLCVAEWPLVYVGLQ